MMNRSMNLKELQVHSNSKNELYRILATEGKPARSRSATRV